MKTFDAHRGQPRQKFSLRLETFFSFVRYCCAAVGFAHVAAPSSTERLDAGQAHLLPEVACPALFLSACYWLVHPREIGGL